MLNNSILEFNFINCRLRLILIDLSPTKHYVK